MAGRCRFRGVPAVHTAGIAVMAAMLVASHAGFSQSTHTIVNPYAQADWSAFQRHRANLHTHTTQSDGADAPDAVIDAYHQMGYTILAITDHNRCTYPWQAWGRDPVALGMLAIAGNEASRHHHLNSFFVVYETMSTSVEQTLLEIGALGGLSHINHPGRYWQPDGEGKVPPGVLQDYIAWMTDHPHVVGIEVINAWNRYPHDRMLWDALLQVMMPGRPVWGFANDDMHLLQFAGLSWNTFVIPELSEAEVRAAMQRGQFYFSTVATHTVYDRNHTPQIISIDHDETTGALTVSAVSGGLPLPDSDYLWVSNGAIVHSGPVLDYRNTAGIGAYVRAELVGLGGTTFTNPFGLVPLGRLCVTIGPPEAVMAGARWRIRGRSAWHESGEWVDMPTGRHVITFRRVGNWHAPSDITIQVDAGIDQEVRASDGALYMFSGTPLPVGDGRCLFLLAFLMACAFLKKCMFTDDRTDR